METEEASEKGGKEANGSGSEGFKSPLEELPPPLEQRIPRNRMEIFSTPKEGNRGDLRTSSPLGASMEEVVVPVDPSVVLGVAGEPERETLMETSPEGDNDERKERRNSSSDTEL
jgi:hypothetical protein